jgi:hypothetical protein
VEVKPAGAGEVHENNRRGILAELKALKAGEAEIAPSGQKPVSLGGIGHARGLQECGTVGVERLAPFLTGMDGRGHHDDGEITDGASARAASPQIFSYARAGV